MSERYISLPCWKVKAFAEGRADLLRMPVKPQPQTDRAGKPVFSAASAAEEISVAIVGTGKTVRCTPPYYPGDILFIKEPWAMMETGSHAYPVFKADFTEDALKEFSASRRKWNAPGTMPQELVRMTYRVNDVRLEPLAAVSATEAIREGTTPCALRELCDRRCEFCAQSEQMVRSYRKTWNASVNENRSTYGAEANPWTWVFRLERVKHFAGTSELPW